MGKETKGVILIALVFFLVAAFMGYLVYEKRVDLEETVLNNNRLRADIAKLKERAEQRDKLVRKLEELQKAVKEYVKILPSAEIATPEKLQKVFYDYAQRTGVDINELEVGQQKTRAAPRRGRGRKRKPDPFDKIEVRFQIQAGFQQFVKFLNLIEKHENFLQVTFFNLEEIKNDDGPARLQVNLTVSTFRYNVQKSK